MENLLKIGETVEVIPESIAEINYTNKPEIGKSYKIGVIYGGRTLTYGLTDMQGRDAFIIISHFHIRPVSVRKTGFEERRELIAA